MWIEDLPNGKYKYWERYTDTKGKTASLRDTAKKKLEVWLVKRLYYQMLTMFLF